MGKGTQAALAALLLLLMAAAVGVFWTSDWRAPAPLPEDAATKAELAAAALVDQRPLQNAQKLAPLATTPEELVLVQEALRIADQEVDLAFDGALQTAIKHPPAPTPAIKKLNARIDALQSRIDLEEDGKRKADQGHRRGEGRRTGQIAGATRPAARAVGARLRRSGERQAGTNQCRRRQAIAAAAYEGSARRFDERHEGRARAKPGPRLRFPPARRMRSIWWGKRARGGNCARSGSRSRRCSRMC